MLWAPGDDGQLRQDGFGHKYDFKALVDRNEGWVRTVNPLDYNVYREGGGTVPTMRVIEFPDDVTALCSTRYLYSWPAQAKSHWTFHDSTHWADSHEGTFGELWLQHFESDYSTYTEAWAQSSFSLPPEPWFAIRLSRQEINPEDWPLTTQPPYTYIDFGKEFRLLIPYGGDPQLYIAGAGDSWVELQPENGNGLSGFEGTGEEAKTIRFGVLRGRVLVSYDDFGEGTVFYKIPLGDSYCGNALRWFRYWAEEGRIEAPRVWSDVVKVGHFGGEFGFTFFPLNAFYSATIPNRYDAPYVAVGYYHTQAPSGVVADVWWEARKDYWTSADDFAVADNLFLIQPSVVKDVGTYSTAANLRFWWTPYKWTSDPGLTCTMTPAVFAAQLRQAANVSGTTSKASTIISPDHAEIDIHELEIEEPEEFGPSFLRLRLSDRGSTLNTLRDFQRIQVKLGEKMGVAGWSNTATVFDGHVRNPQFEPGRGAAPFVHGDLYGFDDVRALVDSKFEGREPDLELLSITEAAMWLGKAAGIKPARLNISACMSVAYLHAAIRTSHAWGYSIEGYNGQKRWEATFGAEYLPTLRDIATHENNSQWYWTCNNRTLNLTKGYWGTAGYQYLAHDRKGDAPSGDYTIYSFEPDRRTADNEDFANYVHLEGKRDDGTPIHAIVWDASSLWSSTAWNYTHGRRIKCVETRDDVRTDEALWSLAYSRLSQLSGKPRGASAEFDLIPGLRRGHIIKTTGATGGRLDDMGGAGQRYLVTGFSHKWWRGKPGRTLAKLKWVGT